MPRISLVALSLALLLCSRPVAQDEPAEPPAVLATKSYEFGGMVNTGAKTPPAQSWLSPDRVFTRPSLEESRDWMLRPGSARLFLGAEDAMQQVLQFCAVGDDLVSFSAETPRSTAVRLTASEDVHKRVAWVMEALRAAASTRVTLSVYRLPSPREEGTLSPADAGKLAASGEIFGTAIAPLGEPLLVHRVKVTEFVQRHEPAADENGNPTAAPATAQLAVGQEILAGALLLPDGRVWLHGYSAKLDLKEMRAAATVLGKLELPRVIYSYTPFSALIENKGGIVASNMLISCRADGVMPNKSIEFNKVSFGLINVAGIVVAAHEPMPWLADTTYDTDFLPLGSGFHSNQPTPDIDSAMYVTATRLVEKLAPLSERLGLAQTLGPYFALRIAEPAGDTGSPEEFEAARRNMGATLARMSAGPTAAQLRVRSWRLDAKKPPAAALASGRPSEQDLQALGTPLFDRAIFALAGQDVDLVEMELAARIAGLKPATEGNVGHCAWGTQVHCKTTAAADGKLEIHLRFGRAEGERKFETVDTGAQKFIERSTRELAQGELSASLSTGECTACVVPTGEGWLVIAAQRK